LIAAIQLSVIGMNVAAPKLRRAKKGENNNAIYPVCDFVKKKFWNRKFLQIILL
jgi:hypothetical protein